MRATATRIQEAAGGVGPSKVLSPKMIAPGAECRHLLVACNAHTYPRFHRRSAGLLTLKPEIAVYMYRPFFAW